MGARFSFFHINKKQEQTENSFLLHNNQHHPRSEEQQKCNKTKNQIQATEEESHDDNDLTTQFPLFFIQTNAPSPSSDSMKKKQIATDNDQFASNLDYCKRFVENILNERADSSLVFICKSKKIYAVQRILFSNYVLSGYTNVIYRLMDRDCLFEHSYVLCVGYKNTQFPQFAGDCQLGLTGKCRVNESPELAAMREIQEEISLNVTSESKLRHLGITENSNSGTKKTTTYNWYGCHISDCDPMLNQCTQKKTEKWTKNDDPLRRVGVFIYGHYLDLILKLASVQTASVCKDTASYIGIVRMCKLLSVLQDLDKKTQWLPV